MMDIFPNSASPNGLEVIDQAILATEVEYLIQNGRDGK